LAGWQLARLVASVGAFRLLPRGAAPPYAVRAAVAPFVPRGGALSVGTSNHPERFVALVLTCDGECATVVKVALGREGREALAREAEALESLAASLPAPLHAPEVLGRDEGVLALQAVPWHPRRRPWILPEEVAAALGAFFSRGSSRGERGLGHGDVAPWNLLEGDGSWTLIDWEMAADDHLPFFDPFHYIVQSHALIRRPRVDALVAALAGRGALGAALQAYARAAGLSLADAPQWFLRYLDESAKALDARQAEGRAASRIRRDLATIVGGPG
jgi:hypothetical protein